MRTLRLVFVSMLFFLAFAVLAQAVTPPPTEPVGIVTGILTAFQGKQWGILLGFIISGIIWGVRTFAMKKWKWAQTTQGGGVISFFLGIFLVIAAELIAGKATFASVLSGVVGSWTASGFFSQVKAATTIPDASTAVVLPKVPAA